MRPEILAAGIAKTISSILDRELERQQHRIDDLLQRVAALEATHAEMKKSYLETRQALQLIEAAGYQSHGETQRRDISH